jgi:F-type H+-transporting ATPase subunit epsilon
VAKLRLDVVTAERLVYSDEVDSVVAPGFDGELGILPRHAALLAMLKPGELRIRKGDEETDLAVSGGFIEVKSNVVTVLADTAERAEEIDVQRAEAAIQTARESLATAARQSPADLERAIASMRRSQVRLRVARRKGRSTHG